MDLDLRHLQHTIAATRDPRAIVALATSFLRQSHTQSAFNVLVGAAPHATGAELTLLDEALASLAKRFPQGVTGRLQHIPLADVHVAFGMLVRGGARDFVEAYSKKPGAPVTVREAAAAAL